LQNISEQPNIVEKIQSIFLFIIIFLLFIQEVFEDALNRVRDNDMNSFSSTDIPMLVDESSIPLITSDTTSDHYQV
jgi:hypothetical protein